MQTIIIKALEQIGFQQQALTFPRQGLPLHALPTSCGYQRITTPEYAWHGQRRGTAEFVVFQYTLAGRGTLEFEKNKFDLTSGTAFLVPVPHQHRYYFPPDSDFWEFIYVCATGREVMRLCHHLLSLHPPLFHLPPESRPVSAAVAILEATADHGIKSAYAASGAAYHLFMTLLDSVQGAQSPRHLPNRLEKVRSYCRKHLADPVDIRRMAAIAQCSRYHFSREFKRHLGITPIKYLTDLRVREAARLLRETNLTLKEIAPRCGFPDGNYLCKVFRASFGIPPNTYRHNGM